jgi:DNA-binding response OmpR family regulator
MRLLLVEDEKKLAEFVARGLRDERYAVDVAHDGESGWGMASIYDYDLIILDLMLPKLSGTDLLKRIRDKGLKAPVLILTARDSTPEKVLNFEAGADDYLTKPFAFAELAVRVKALLRRGTTERSNVLRVDDLEVDRVNRKVRRAGRRIELTVKEYCLLEVLAANPGRVMSRRVIIEHVWDSSFEGLTKIVDVHIRNLRAKIDTGHPRPLIHTVRGIGYSIELDPKT